MATTTTRVDLKYMTSLTDLKVEGDNEVAPSKSKMEILQKRHSENTVEGPRMRTRVNLEKIRLLMQKAYKDEVNKAKMFTTNILNTKQSKISMHKYWSMYDRIMHSEWATADTLPAQLGVVLAILCETRQFILDMYDMGKIRGAKAEKITQDLMWMDEPFQMLEALMNEFFYEYGVARTSKLVVEESNSDSQSLVVPPKKNHRRHKSYIGVGDKYDEVIESLESRNAAGDIQEEEENENVNANTPASPVQSEELVKTVTVSVVPADQEEPLSNFQDALQLKCLIEAPLVFLQERIHRFSEEDKTVLFQICPNLKNLTTQVVHFVEQGYDDIVVSLYIAETVGKALMSIFRKTENRHKFYASLMQVYSCARGISWAALAFNRNTDMFAYETATDDDIERMCRKGSQIY